MPEPKKRHSKSKVGRRRANQGLKKIALSVCAKCSAPTLPHRICSNCGEYAKAKKAAAK
ncbi:MAG: 50S ribosomal protein L32 [bacterium]|nr:50S ribosomal protein L32 [bacterium]MDZ4231496.1 50S ribosomal protein L32 [Patescibacteria group bacterium]